MVKMSHRIYMPGQVRELDRIAIEEQGIPGYELMTRAGQACFNEICVRFPNARRWLIVCGSGNNAGDGYVIARLAYQHGIEVRLIAMVEPEVLTGDAAKAWQDYQGGGGEYVSWDEAPDFSGMDIVLDALLGTGLERPLKNTWLNIVQVMNESTLPVVAVDIATGLNGATGAVMGDAVYADLTVTFVGLKQGLFVGAGPARTGELVYADLAIEQVDEEQMPPSLKIFSRENFTNLFPPRVRTAHKGSNGHVLVMGGNTGMGGAVCLAGEAALRGGAGLVSVATRPDNIAPLIANRPELMAHGIETGNELDDLLDRADVIALGPGLGSDDWAQHIYARALAMSKPLVLDADALNLLAMQPVRRDDWILTPHPGEAARLLRTNTAAIQADRPGAVQALVDKFGGTVLLKGHGTLITSDELACPWFIQVGNPGMATAGMGDVLTGLAAALLAQSKGKSDASVSFADIAAAAAWVHATSGDQAALQGERGLIATDLLVELRSCLNS
ncbi:MAG: NAD(P)H-hydrate dehydratase [Gammaproteobacteria bacterium]|nr:NAD(P)H-hydrate dehydratase [Gammaproteobacteria bacterium]MCP4091110.1 NAD(P)H-hydrate dehydratase [Gammaproteobacteria bacterium]MCP4277364.1 NAD(P)H-hydrate dehydratase [Gammaproteobacteria bacterium]MCP4831575.1 NAD(P)H-hydrate dehydratase [Gammaproteobacteria bacterium]MCP4927798.1 NAD(P)H-hydrate dehydratase [Gammaproteobacteria bacterium]